MPPQERGSELALLNSKPSKKTHARHYQQHGVEAPARAMMVTVAVLGDSLRARAKMARRRNGRLSSL